MKGYTMSLDHNIITIIGRFTKDPETRYTPNGDASLSGTIANNYGKGKVSFFDIEAWKATAEAIGKFCQKGSKVLVEGWLKQERWEKDGKSNSKIKIVVNKIYFLDNRNESYS